MRTTLAEFGISTGIMPRGKTNTITDVPGVRVGHSTSHDPEHNKCSGVTAIWPEQIAAHGDHLAAAAYVLNGTGKTVGLMQITEHGVIETPILMTGTLAVFRSADYLVRYLREKRGWSFSSLNPVVSECNDSYLSDPTGDAVSRENVYEALDSVSVGPVELGCVGAGTGMRGFGYKGGIGSASRTTEAGHTVGMLVLLNCGSRQRLTVAGKHVGPKLPALNGKTNKGRKKEQGSIIMVLATDAPLSPHYLARMVRRVPLGLARAGGTAGHGSGDVVIGFSTAQKLDFGEQVISIRTVSPRHCDPLFDAAVEATEEAIVSALLAADDTAGRDRRLVRALPLDSLKSALSAGG